MFNLLLSLEADDTSIDYSKGYVYIEYYDDVTDHRRIYESYSIEDPQAAYIISTKKVILIKHF